MNKAQKIIRCIVVSDIHEDISVLNKIPLGNEGKFDYCFALGDYISLDANQVDKEEYMTQGKKTIKEIITILEGLSNEVVYIAGNHDPAFFFTEASIKLTEHSHYLHKQYYQLDEDLYVAGIGGSIVAVLDGKNDKEWDGYPYNQDSNTDSDNAFKKDIIETLDLLKSNPNASKKKIVLLTHNGPKNDTTTKSIHDNKVVQSGSSELCKIISDTPGIILNVHGHTHYGHGEYMINKTVIANPGSTRDKRYLIIVFAQMAKEEWCLSISHKLIE